MGISGYYYNKWLEYQFDENMSWDNYGSYWEIDHLVPIDSFDLTNGDEIYECFDWKNTRPMESSANSAKSNIVDKKIIRNHRTIVESFFNSMEGIDEFDDNDRYSYYIGRLYGFT